MKRIACVAMAIALSGCTVVGAPPSSNEQLVLDTAGDIGAVSCAIAKTQLKPQGLINAKIAVLAAKTVLNDPEPSLTAIQQALAAGVDEEWADAVGVLVQRLRKRLGQADALPVDTLGWQAASEALDACQAALG